MTAPIPALEDILQASRAGPTGKAVLARALALIEEQPENPAVISLLDKAWKTPKAHVLGLTGPPGVGKSTLISALIRAWRDSDRTVAVIAVDPSSRKSGGALLGDRTRLVTDPEDTGAFIRSMAARDRLGGLAALTAPAMVLMRAVYDIVLIETVGVGQSETDVAAVADTVIFCVQPASGDSLQYMKAGIMEVPHVAVVTKSDMGPSARRAKADVEGALGLAHQAHDGWTVPVTLVSATDGKGIADLVALADSHYSWLQERGRLSAAREVQGNIWLEETIREKFGSEGLKRVGDLIAGSAGQSPFARQTRLLAFLHSKSGG